MTFGYARPFTFKIGGNQVKAAAIRHGVTEIVLNDGRLIRAVLQIKAISPSRHKAGLLDISYTVATEIVDRPNTATHAVNETLQ